MIVRDVAFYSDGGPHRSRNEDFALVDEEQGVFIVADGLGGAAAGDRASKVAAHTVCSFLTSQASPQAAMESLVPDRLTKVALKALLPEERENQSAATRMKMAFIVAHTKVLEEGRTSGCVGMATAMIAAWHQEGNWWIGHVGDCRGYVLYQGKLTLLTRDHSLSAALAGRRSVSQSIENSPFLRSRLTQVVGGETLPSPDVNQVTLEQGSRLLLCSDGVWGSLTKNQITAVLKTDDSAAALARELGEQAIVEKSRDNVTALVVMS